MDALRALLYQMRPSEWGGWYFFTIVALLLYGVYQYCLDVLVTRRSASVPRSLTAVLCVSASTAVVAMLCGVRTVWTVWADPTVLDQIAEACFLGLLQGLLFLCVNLFRFRSRDVFPQHIVLPVTKASILLVVLCSWALFEEFRSVTAQQLGGFFCVGISIYLFREGEVGTSNKDKAQKVLSSDPRFKSAAFSLGMATVVSAAIALLAKYSVGTSAIDVITFMFFSNLFTSLIGFAMVHRNMKAAEKDARSAAWRVDLKKAMYAGLVLGFLNLLAYAALLHALSLGNASSVIPMHSLYVIIPILIFALVDGEPLTEKTTVAIVLSVVAMMFLKG